MTTRADPTARSDEAWRRVLSPEEYRVTRCSATEPAFTGKYWDHKGDGVYACVCCGVVLFDSGTKYDSRSGWPSFWDVVDQGRVELVEDRSHGMVRTEVRCKACRAHLGHVFEDGPAPTGLRFCINSAALRFRDRQATAERH